MPSKQALRILKTEEENYEVYTDIGDLESVKDSLISKDLTVVSANMTMVPDTTVEVDLKHAEQLLKLMDKLEDHDDVQNVYSDFDIPDEVMEKLSIE